MNKIEAKRELESLLKKLDKLNNVDSIEELPVKAINDIHTEIARVDIDDRKEDQDALWKEAWDGSRNVHLPEVITNHDIRYINSILKRIDYWE